MSQYNTPASEAPPWWESTWALAKPEIVRPTLGMSFSGGERNQLFLNHAGKEFTTLSGVSGADDPDDPRGFAYLDFDRDGWVDMALGSRARPSFKLFKNNIGRGHAERHSLGVRFVGGNRSASASTEFGARDGYGASLSLELESGKILREHRAGEGWRTQNSSTVLVGLGNAESVPRLVVKWPSGKQLVIENVPADKLITVYENVAESADGSGYDMRPYRVQSGAAPGVLAASESVRKSEFPLPASSTAEFTMFTSTATWCAACRRELPHLKRLRESFSPEQLEMVGVPTDLSDTPAMLEAYVQQSQPAYRLLNDLSDADRKAFSEYVRLAMHTEVLPATVILRRDGTPVYAEPGTPTLSKVRELMDRADRLTRRETWASSKLTGDEVLSTPSRKLQLLIGLGAVAILALGFRLVRRGNHKGA